VDTIPSIRSQTKEAGNCNIVTKEEPKFINLSKSLFVDMKKSYVDLFKECVDVFA